MKRENKNKCCPGHGVFYLKGVPVLQCNRVVEDSEEVFDMRAWLEELHCEGGQCGLLMTFPPKYTWCQKHNPAGDIEKLMKRETRPAFKVKTEKNEKRKKER